jgi:glycerophosphoryl diester phosphodiesterase
LEAAIRLARGKLKLNIEIKIFKENQEISDRVVDIIHKENFSQDCMVTSFDRATIERIVKLAPDIMTGYIFGSEPIDSVYTGSWQLLSCSKSIVTADLIKKAHKNNKKVHVWTVNDQQRMKELIRMRVDGIITNYPDRLKEVLSK